MASFTSALVQPSGRVLISYLFRVADSTLYKPGTDTFENVVLADLVGNAARAPYRLTYTEGAPGSYSWNIDIDGFNGEYQVKSRELVGEVEYSYIKTETFSVDNNVLDTSISVAFSSTAGQTIIAYIKQVSSSLFYNKTSLSFEALSLSEANEATRDPFRVAFNEDPQGSYKATFPSVLADGNYEVFTYAIVDNIEVEFGLPSIVRVKDNKELIGVTFDTIALSEDTGGADTLRYITSANQGVSEAQIVVYLKSEYDAGNFNDPKGSTITRSDGRWMEPIRVTKGLTYTVVFHKPGHYGPNEEVVVL